MLHLRATELMSGQHHFVDPALGPASDQPCHFRLDWGGPAREALNSLRRRPVRYTADGTIHFAGLTHGETPCHGTICIDYAGEHRIAYDLGFEHEGRHYSFRGEKVDVHPSRPLELVKTHTTCYGTLTSDGRVVSRSILHFARESLPSFLRSFRLTRRS